MTVSDQERYNLYCMLVALLATTKDVNKVVDSIIEAGWRPQEIKREEG